MPSRRWPKLTLPFLVLLLICSGTSPIGAQEIDHDDYLLPWEEDTHALTETSLCSTRERRETYEHCETEISNSRAFDRGPAGGLIATVHAAAFLSGYGEFEISTAIQTLDQGSQYSPRIDREVSFRDISITPAEVFTFLEEINGGGSNSGSIDGATWENIHESLDDLPAEKKETANGWTVYHRTANDSKVPILRENNNTGELYGHEEWYTSRELSVVEVNQPDLSWQPVTVFPSAPVCEQIVEFGDHVVKANSGVIRDDIYLDPFVYDVAVETADRSHAIGYQTNQRREQWLLELTRGDEPFWSSPKTADLAEVETYRADFFDQPANMNKPATDFSADSRGWFYGLSTTHAVGGKLSQNPESIYPLSVAFLARDCVGVAQVVEHLTQQYSYTAREALILATNERFLEVLREAPNRGIYTLDVEQLARLAVIADTNNEALTGDDREDYLLAVNLTVNTTDRSLSILGIEANQFLDIHGDVFSYHKKINSELFGIGQTILGTDPTPIKWSNSSRFLKFDETNNDFVSDNGQRFTLKELIGEFALDQATQQFPPFRKLGSGRQVDADFREIFSVNLAKPGRALELSPDGIFIHFGKLNDRIGPAELYGGCALFAELEGIDKDIDTNKFPEDCWVTTWKLKGFQTGISPTVEDHEDGYATITYPSKIRAYVPLERAELLRDSYIAEASIEEFVQNSSSRDSADPIALWALRDSSASANARLVYDNAFPELTPVEQDMWLISVGEGFIHQLFTPRGLLEIVGSVPGIDTFGDAAFCLWDGGKWVASRTRFGDNVDASKLDAGLSCAAVLVPAVSREVLSSSSDIGRTVNKLDNAPTAGRAARNGKSLSFTTTPDIPNSAKKIPEDYPDVNDLAGSCGINSFTADTPVVMADETTLSISNIETGDTVLAVDPATGETSDVRVIDSYSSTGEKSFIEINIDSSSTVTATADHPFWVANQQRWVTADDLAVGDQLLSVGEDTAGFVSGLRSWTADDDPAHNLAVTAPHTFVVQPAGASSGVVVHNNSPACEILGKTEQELANLRSADQVKFSEYTNANFPAPSTKAWTASKERIKTRTDQILNGDAGIAGDPDATGGVYVLIDKNNVVRRTGKTNDFKRRNGEHDSAFGSELRFRPVVSTDSETLRRGIEQSLFESYANTARRSIRSESGELVENQFGQNIRQSVGDKAPFRNFYYQTAVDFKL